MGAIRKIRVLIVDDSASVRQALKAVLEEDADFEVMGAAPDPFVAAQIIRESVPDVITLDVEMPRMDGITFLDKLMAQHPIPVVICSSLTDAGSRSAVAALERGAVDVICKPRIGTKQFFADSALQIRDTVRAAARTPAGRPRLPRPELLVRPKLTADEILAAPTGRSMLETTERILAVGASTGGTEALRILFAALPTDAPGVVAVLHMPEKFTAAYARRLDSLCRVTVLEATDGAPVLPGHVLIAPGNRHTLLKRSGARYYTEVRDGPLVCRHRPSVDVLFRSAARYAGANAVGILLTGMGDDGAVGLGEMRTAGAATIAQDEATSVVFGMPGEAIRLGAAAEVLPLEAIAGRAIALARGRRPRENP